MYKHHTVKIVNVKHLSSPSEECWESLNWIEKEKFSEHMTMQRVQLKPSLKFVSKLNMENIIVIF